MLILIRYNLTGRMERGGVYSESRGKGQTKLSLVVKSVKVFDTLNETPCILVYCALEQLDKKASIIFD